MDLIKRSVRIERNIGKFVCQTTMEQDMNIPDNKPDVETIVLRHGHISLENVRVTDERAELGGKLAVCVMYKCQDGTGESAPTSMECLEGEIPFKETVQLLGVSQTDFVSPMWDLEDLRVRILNSRKLTISALVTFTLEADREEEVELAEEISEDDESALEIDHMDEEMDVLELAVRKKDICRIREEVELGSNKPNIQKLLWKSVTITGLEAKLEEGKLILKGELLLFAIYSGEEEHIPLQWMEKSISFNEELDCPQAAVGQIADVCVSVSQADAIVKPDYDGENRNISLDIGLELLIRLYEEKSYKLISDAYSPKEELVMETKDTCLPHLLIKNNAKCRLVSKLQLPEDAGCLQICSSSCRARIDHVSREDDVSVEGIVDVSLIYMSSDDTMPIKCLEESIPFTHSIEAESVGENAYIQIRPSVEQLSTVMLSAGEVEVRVSLNLDTFACDRKNVSLIEQITTRPFDEVVLSAMPAMIGYVVKPGDTLWSIAKSFYTSIDRVRRYNALTSDNLRPGEKLLIVKEGVL